MKSFLEILQIQYPVIQAPMALADSPLLAATVSNQGGLGSFSAALFSPDEIRNKIREIHRLTSKPFAVNLFAPLSPKQPSQDELDLAVTSLNYFRKLLGMPDVNSIEIQSGASFEEKLAILIEEKVPVFSFTFGVLPREIIQSVKAQGMKILGTATTVREAIALEKSGVDMVVAQGFEAGGHRGTDLNLTSIDNAYIGTMALVPQMVDAVNIPVIASGGIMNGRGIAAALALGASAVQMGTAFLTCSEAQTHAAHRKLLLNSTDENTQLTSVFTGRMARSLQNQFMRDMQKKAFPVLDYPLQSAIVKDIREAAQKQNNPEFMSLWAGQASHYCQELPAAELFDQLIQETRETFAKLNNTAIFK